MTTGTALHKIKEEIQIIDSNAAQSFDSLSKLSLFLLLILLSPFRALFEIAVDQRP